MSPKDPSKEGRLILMEFVVRKAEPDVPVGVSRVVPVKPRRTSVIPAAVVATTAEEVGLYRVRGVGPDGVHARVIGIECRVIGLTII